MSGIVNTIFPNTQQITAPNYVISGNLGIGTTTPTTKLDVAGAIAVSGVTVIDSGRNITGGAPGVYYGTNGVYPTNNFALITAGIPGINDAFNGNGGVGATGQGLRLTGQRLTWTSTSYESYIEIDGGRSTNAAVNNGQVRFYTANAQRLVINEDGNVGIGKTNPDYKLHVSGGACILGAIPSQVALYVSKSTNANPWVQDHAVTCYGNMESGYAVLMLSTGHTGADRYTFISKTTGHFYIRTDGYTYAAWFGQGSDERIKGNIRPLYASLDKVMQLRPVLYNRRKFERNESKQIISDTLETRDRIGFIAQEVKVIVPEIIEGNENSLDPEEGGLAIEYQTMVVLLTKALQELKNEFDNYVKTHQ